MSRVNGSVCVQGIRVAAVLLLIGTVLLSCEPSSPEVKSTLQGHITVRADVDTTQDYSGFRVLVMDTDGRAVDTLAHATTNTQGRFETSVRAPERGIYPLVIWGRQGQRHLARADYVVADGDSATLNVTFPLQGRQLRIRSEENSALAAYQNTMIQHRRTMVGRLDGDIADMDAMGRSVRQTSSMLWNLQETYPGTYASQLAATESLSLLASWNDSLVVERARTIESSNPRFVEAARIARGAAARRAGQDGALDILDFFAVRAETNDQQAGVQAARVQAFIDSLQVEAASSAAQTLKNNYPHTSWSEWADRALYEVNNLIPGAEAPNFAARTTEGESISVQGFQGRPVVLEYFRPEDDVYRRQVATRNALYEATRSDSVAFVSVNVDPDTLLHRAFMDGRDLLGHRIIAANGPEDATVKAYNVANVPTRFLIDENGRIAGRYDGSAFLTLQEDLARMLQPDAENGEPDAS